MKLIPTNILVVVPLHDSVPSVQCLNSIELHCNNKLYFQHVFTNNILFTEVGNIFYINNFCIMLCIANKRCWKTSWHGMSIIINTRVQDNLQYCFSPSLQRGKLTSNHLKNSCLFGQIGEAENPNNWKISKMLLRPLHPIIASYQIICSNIFSDVVRLCVKSHNSYPHWSNYVNVAEHSGREYFKMEENIAW